MEIKEEIKEERERIKKLIQRKVEGMFIMRERSRVSKSRKKSIPRSDIKRMLEDLNFLIDNPDYVRKGAGVTLNSTAPPPPNK